MLKKYCSIDALVDAVNIPFGEAPDPHTHAPQHRCHLWFSWRAVSALLLLAAALLRCPRGWKLTLESTDGGGSYAAWYPGETLGEAVLRFAWLLVAKWLALRTAPLSVGPAGGPPGQLRPAGGSRPVGQVVGAAHQRGLPPPDAVPLRRPDRGGSHDLQGARCKSGMALGEGQRVPAIGCAGAARLAPCLASTA